MFRSFLDFLIAGLILLFLLVAVVFEVGRDVLADYSNRTVEISEADIHVSLVNIKTKQDLTKISLPFFSYISFEFTTSSGHTFKHNSYLIKISEQSPGKILVKVFHEDPAVGQIYEGVLEDGVSVIIPSVVFECTKLPGIRFEAMDITLFTYHDILQEPYLELKSKISRTLVKAK